MSTMIRRSAVFHDAEQRCPGAGIDGCNRVSPAHDVVGQQIDANVRYRKTARRRVRLCSPVREHCPARSNSSAAAAPRWRCGESDARFSSEYFWRKCCTSSGISSRRCRSGGQVDADYVQAIEQIFAELAFLHHLRRSTLVAAMMRNVRLNFPARRPSA